MRRLPTGRVRHRFRFSGSGVGLCIGFGVSANLGQMIRFAEGLTPSISVSFFVGNSRLLLRGNRICKQFRRYRLSLFSKVAAVMPILIRNSNISIAAKKYVGVIGY